MSACEAIVRAGCRVELCCARYEAVRVKQQQFPSSSAEPREIAQIKELAQEMTSLREELWQLKSAGTPASVSAAAGAAVAASNSRNGRRRGGR